MSLYRALRISASALTAERLRMDVISNNIANSQTTRTAQGGPYRRKVVVFAPQDGRRAPVFFVPPFRRSGDPAELQGLAGVRVQAIQEVEDEPIRVYEPSHPDADEDGYVEYPNVDITTEIVDLMAASRAYQANVTVIQTAKTTAQAALDIGR